MGYTIEQWILGGLGMIFLCFCTAVLLIVAAKMIQETIRELKELWDKCILREDKVKYVIGVTVLAIFLIACLYGGYKITSNLL